MTRRILVAAALALVACHPDPLVEPSPWREELVALERAVGAATWEDPRQSPHFDPDGLLVEPDGALWAWSRRQPTQMRVSPTRDGWAITEQRQGPLGTRQCVAGGGRLPTAICVGDREPGGLLAFGSPFTSGLPPRLGFSHVAADPDRGVLWVVDPVDAVLHTLDAAGAPLGVSPLGASPLGVSPLGVSPLPPAPSRVGMAGPDHLWVLAGGEPRLCLLPLAADGRPAGAWIPIPLYAPVRDAAWDADRALLWTVGPEDRQVRRQTGPIEGAGSVLRAHPLAALLAGDPSPSTTIPLWRDGHVDATRVAVSGLVAVAATGSDELLMLDPATGVLTARDAGLAPSAVAFVDGRVAVAARLDDAVLLFPPAGPPTAVTLDPSPRATDADLGERMFYSATIWQRRSASDVTCNTCHWDGGTDHRLHPGFHEERWEMTRPLGGIGAVSPIFSTGYAPTLADAVEGLIRSLDPRLWDPDARGVWWEEPLRLRTKGGERTLSPREIRVALLTYLATLPATPPPLRAPGSPLSPGAVAGWQVFSRDCAACHLPTADMRAPAPVADPVAHLVEAPLTFGSGALGRTGAAPLYTREGNRSSPLLGGATRARLFTDGSAPDLAALLAGYRRGSARVHGGGEGSALTPDEVSALRRFLLEAW